MRKRDFEKINRKDVHQLTIGECTTKYLISNGAFKDALKNETAGEEDSFISKFLAEKQQLGLKIQKGVTTPKFQIGGQEFSNDEWEKVLHRVDTAIKPDENSSIIDYLKGDERKCPYGALAKDGIIEYNGVIFQCDYEKNALYLGDMSEGADIITVNLPSGGTLKINADNIDQISRCAGMFTPEDLNAILRAIHEHEHTKHADMKAKDDSDEFCISKLHVS